MGLVLLQEGELSPNDITLRIRTTLECPDHFGDIAIELEGMVLIDCSVDPKKQTLGSLDGCLFHD